MKEATSTGHDKAVMQMTSISETAIKELAEMVRPHVMTDVTNNSSTRLPGVSSIVLEGGEGCGKGTIQHALVRVLRAAGLDAIGIREPGGSPMGERIRDVLLDDFGSTLSPASETLLFAASRAQLICDVVRPNIASGKILVFDRFVQSSYVYQGIVGHVGLRQVMDVNAMALDGFSPSVSLFLDVPPQVGLARIAKAQGTREVNWLDRKPLAWHEAVHDGYMRLVSDGLLTRIDASQSPDAVLRQCVYAMLSATSKVETGRQENARPVPMHQ